MTTDDLLAAAQDLAQRYPRADLIKNSVGNLVVVDEDGQSVAYLDLSTGEIDTF
ncbi:hypothetical protein NDR87_30880 [Nocardia sp. CDC159]|uniref:Uncharacterized protein n=1 Tax=Nocardia pulmonis TaxID=2951408 RepID=A0A9X2J1F5_9NOCA|nr:MULTISPECIES: hypothetical protein [Nocardia]MCM6778045.1 hypothetical protein [Nocardia pulmonis]MCM6790784.1 hypothetical protein [Nocardia sp. CDC159]